MIIMKKLDLKGIWIPIKVLTDKNLSDKEKVIYSIILFLSKEKEFCFCTNSNISELLNISITQVSKLINSLKEKMYLNIEMEYKENSKEIKVRKLIAKNRYSTKVKYPSYTKVKQPVEEKFKDNNINNKENKYIKYINSQLKQKKKEVNFEQRDLSGLDFSQFYANLLPSPADSPLWKRNHRANEARRSWRG